MDPRAQNSPQFLRFSPIASLPASLAPLAAPVHTLPNSAQPLPPLPPPLTVCPTLSTHPPPNHLSSGPLVCFSWSFHCSGWCEPSGLALSLSGS
ncbi:hypothetical protein N7468_001908 [Penicillium chermesinum]|uniref:Uncharacterized protein n=1 Tax=Penicillium chermesinum TaxID=63820 RepID=A0A9W9TX47_9EURO|nr:uncharacterized protein N7468_001908 [Penicillium chermesinum]KAJ5246925.1 hypothetical protein N7468_001908 [Penicillium chermesinum]